MQSKAKTVLEYLAELPDDRRAAIQAIRATILENLDQDIEEGMQYGMIGYFIPHRIFPAGYHCDPKQPLPFAHLASQKNHLAMYFMCIYGDPELATWFRTEWEKTGKKLDLGGSCIRFKKIVDVPLDLIAKLIARVSAKKYIARYESNKANSKTGKTIKKASVKKQRE